MVDTGIHERRADPAPKPGLGRRASVVMLAVILSAGAVLVFGPIGGAQSVRASAPGAISASMGHSVDPEQAHPTTTTTNALAAPATTTSAVPTAAPVVTSPVAIPT